MGGLSSWMFGIWADIWVGLPLAALVGLVIGRLVLICVLPLDFHGRLRVVRDPCALHVLRPFLLMIACCGVSPWLVLVLCSMCQIVLGDVTQPFAWSGFVLGCLRRYLAYPYRLLDAVVDGYVHRPPRTPEPVQKRLWVNFTNCAEKSHVSNAVSLSPPAFSRVQTETRRRWRRGTGWWWRPGQCSWWFPVSLRPVIMQGQVLAVLGQVTVKVPQMQFIDVVEVPSDSGHRRCRGLLL